VALFAVLFDFMLIHGIRRETAKNCEMATVQDNLFPGHLLSVPDLRLRDGCGTLGNRIRPSN